MTNEEVEFELPQFNHTLSGKASALKLGVGTREGGESTFHDAFLVTADMPFNGMHEALEAIGLTKTTFVDDLPEEAPQIEIPRSFSDHTLVIKYKNKKVVEVDSVDIKKFVAIRVNDETARLVLSVGVKPPRDQHIALEGVILDSHSGGSFKFQFGPPKQGTVPGAGGDE